MPISSLGKIAIATASVGSIGGVAYGYIELSKVTLKDKLEQHLIKATETEKWKSRVAILKEDESELSAGLKAIKESDDATDKKIKEWCEKNLANKFVGESDKSFKEAQKYCAYNIKDQITGAIEISAWDPSTHNTKLKGVKTDIKLSPEMTKIKTELTTKENALKDWCKASYEKPFKNEEDQDFIDTKTYCTPS